MKSLVALVLFSLSLGSMAQTVELDRAEVSVYGAEVIVARTNRTPKKVTLNMTVPMEKSICEQTGIHHVMRTSSIHCGNDVITRVRSVEVCTRRDPNNRNRCLLTRRENRPERVVIPRTCMVPESVCVRFGTTVVSKRDDMTIEFKKLHALADSEADLFLVRAVQKGFDSDGVRYEVEALETIAPVKVKRAGRLFGSSDDDFEVTRK